MSSMNTDTTFVNANGPPIVNESTPLISNVLARDDMLVIGPQATWSQKAVKKIRDFVGRNTGLLLIMASQSLFSAINVAIKKLGSLDPPLSTMELIAVRMGVTFICSLLFMKAAGIQDPILGPSGIRLLLLLRGFAGFTGLFGIYFSLQYLSLSDATVLRFLVPICTLLSGAIFLGETFSYRQVLAGSISLIGVILIARPTFLFGPGARDLPSPSKGNSIVIPNLLQKATSTERLIAVGVALLGVCGATAAYTTIRAIGKRAHALHLLTCFSGICVFISTICMVVMKTPIVVPTRLEWLSLLLLIGIVGFAAQIFLTMGFQYETAGRGAMAIYTQIVFASIFERIFFHTVPSSLSVIGMVLIIGSALFVALTKETSGQTNGKSTMPDPPSRSKDDIESRIHGCTDDGTDDRRK